MDEPRIEAALARLARRPRPPSRWWALLPTRVSAGGRSGVRAGSGLYLAPDEPVPSTRWLRSVQQGWSVQLSWDLRQLWTSRLRPDARHLAHALAVDRVAARISAAVAAVGESRAMARGARAWTPVCLRAQARAQAALLRLRTLVAAAR